MTSSDPKLAKLGDLVVEYERFFTVSLDMLCISSYDGHFKKVNPAFEQTLGFSSEELCKKSYLDFIHPDDIERTTQEVQKQLESKQQVFNFENRYRCKDGSYRWLSWKSAPVGDFMYAVARDVTESKRVEEEIKKAKAALEISNRELESFSSTVAHDLRAPIRGIIGFTALILEDRNSKLSEEAQSHFKRVIRAASKMGILIDGLLDFSRLARRELMKHFFDLSAVVEEAAQELQSSTPGRKVRFTIKPGIQVNGDPVLLRTVVANLLGNAWKYSSKANRDITIEFGTMEIAGERVLFVKDNGAGFEMAHVDKLFGVFQRLHTAQEFEGTGIGLVTTQRIIQRHGGRIWAEAAVDQGATFYFTLG